ncbi:Signal transduction histidine kinase [Pedobacter sp. ok626]|uniref:hybrid sensor histidine kinase/response regulator transcription factor n=1 Tax=Pedobacter sp. ok626 TaxID=1761882 RepID=UPI00088F1ED0|nr:hybrid sensor histidine kinase/response regulator transcription factor [Pedobacter sp. ok626]SDK67648.1 Signal transduction histidine kinase [Pedobacter sp. ok626]
MLNRAILKRFYLCFLYTVLVLSPGYAQNQKINFTSLKTKDGLSSNTINAILKDRYGIMWFGTEDGLNKFDGTNFTVYKHKSDDPTGIQANDIRAIHEDKSGNLWIGSSGGSLSLYDRKKNSFINFSANTGEGLSSDVIRTVSSDYTGKIWVATFSGLDLLDPKTRTVKKLSLQVGPKRAFPAMTFNCLYEDSRHRMWIGSNNGIYLYERETNSFKNFTNSVSDPSSLCDNAVSSIVEDQAGNLWFGTRNGLSLLLPDGTSFKNFWHDSKNPNTLTNNMILSLAASTNNQLWIGTEDGLNILNIKTGDITRYKPDSRDIYSLTGKSISYIYIDNQGIYWLGVYHGGINKYDTNLNLFQLKQGNVFDQNGLNTSVVTSFAKYRDDEIFVGTDGGGLNLFNRKTELFKRFNVPLANGSTLSNISIMSMEIARSKQLYLGTYSNGLVVMDLKTGQFRQITNHNSHDALNSNDIFCVKEDKGGKIWVGTNGGGVNVLNSKDKVLVKYCKNPKAINERDYPGNNFVRFIEEDNAGNIWIGSYGSGIAVFNPHSNKFIVYSKANSKLPNDLTMSILKDRLGNIWVGTFSGGLSLFDDKTGQFITFSEKDGLNNATVYAIVEDKQGKIWLSTNKGISSFDRKTKKFTNYTIYNGVQNNNFVLGAGFSSSDGEIYFGGADGFNYFNPQYFKKNKNVSRVLFTDLKIGNTSIVASADGPIKEHISVVKDIYLDYKQNFTLSYVSVNYTAPEQNRYSYRLEGFDNEWINAGNSKSVSYTNLDPGEYVFHVKASNNDGLWNGAETAIRIHVLPPFWRTIYAYVLYVLVIVGTLLYIRHRGIQKLKLKFAQVQEKMKAEQLIEEERKEAERLRELDKLKIKFLTNLSHEFRTPLSLIMGPVDKLLTERRDIEIAGPLAMIKRNTRRLLNLVNQILDFRKMEDQELRLNPSEVDIVAFIKEVLESFNDLSERKQIQLVFKSQMRCFYTLFDQDKIERVLFNLLSNAFKFTPVGGIISLEVEKSDRLNDGQESSLIIKVSDTGIGMSAEDKEKIFDRFFQAETSAPILNQGSGIGLSIAKEFVKMHGGDIAVQTELGKGSNFIIELPFSTTETADELTIDFSGSINSEPEIVTEADENVNGIDIPSVLLVEDNEDFRFYLKDSLKSFYRIYEACNGQEGWQKALAHHPQVIVSDINMPYMNGIELCCKVKSDKRTNHIPIILLTALTGEEEQLRGLETGANDYLTKPFNFEILNAKIKNLLTLNKTLKDTYTKQIKVQTPEVVIESHSDRLLNKVLLYIEENLNNPKLSVEDLSRHVGMSRGSLYHKILELTGESPVEYIRSVKLDKATVLLEKSDLNVSQIAYMVGFATPNYFAKSFKAKFNVQPSEFMNLKRKTDVNLV